MKKAEIDRAIESVDEYARGALSAQRYAHSARVATLSRSLSSRFSVDPDLGYLAGIAHDICKAEREERLLALAEADGLPISPLEREKPSLLHGRCAAVLLSRQFAVQERSVLEAVRHHTFGAVQLDELGKIVFVADKIEPGRADVDPSFRARVLAADLDAMTCLILEDNVRYLKAKGREVSAVTVAMLQNLKGRIVIE